MITQEKLTAIQQKYGEVASWAIWHAADSSPKSNMGADGVFDFIASPNKLKLLKPNIIFVALNFSQDVVFQLPFENFHSTSPHAHDHKIRHAFINTPYSGGYMTDLLKNIVNISSKSVEKYLSNNPEVLAAQIKSFEREIKLVSSEPPTLLAFGNITHRLIQKHVDSDNYRRLIKIPHYSNYIGQDSYRDQVHKILSINEDPQSKIILKRSHQHLLKQQYREAIQLVEKALKAECESSTP
jgi:hypothetical protein